MTLLRGITWDHTRGMTSVVAATQRYHERHGTLDVIWEKRSLQAFADFSLDELSARYDLLVIDHPWVGTASHRAWLVPLEQWLSEEDLKTIQKASVGLSYESYVYEEHLWALPIDAAAPVAAWRPDVLAQRGVEVPQTWDDLLGLARQRIVVLPAKAIDLLMHYYMLVNALGGDIGRTDPGQLEMPMVEALERLRELVSLCPQEVLKYNPIAVYELMTATDAYGYCPFGYGYVNYAMPGYARQCLTFGDVVRWTSGATLNTVLGGTGLAISARSRHVEEAVRVARFVADAATQASVYAWAGGQPAAAEAWRDPLLNHLTNSYYQATWPTLQRAWIRPRYPGYLAFQDKAGALIHEYVKWGGDPGKVVSTLLTYYQNTREGGRG
jgi:multiple sugar transport system substrate-binding protein